MLLEKIAIVFTYSTHASRAQSTIKTVIARHCSTLTRSLINVPTQLKLIRKQSVHPKKKKKKKRRRVTSVFFVYSLEYRHSADRSDFSRPRNILHTNQSFSSNGPWNVSLLRTVDFALWIWIGKLQRKVQHVRGETYRQCLYCMGELR
jgi:hypothetical protein